MKRRSASSSSGTAFVLLLLLLFSPGQSSAQTTVYGTRTVPEIPLAGTIFSVQLTAYNCDTFWSASPWDREVTVSGSSITVTVPYTAPFSSGGCDFTRPYVVSWYLGPFQAGQYTLTMVGVDPLSGDLSLEESIPLTIAENVAPNVVPAQSMGSLFIVGLLVGILGLFAARRIA